MTKRSEATARAASGRADEDAGVGAGLALHVLAAAAGSARDN